MRDRERRKQRNEEERCKPEWKMRGNRREGKQNTAEDRKALEAACPELDLSLGGLV